MARHARPSNTRRREALYLVAITFVFGCVSSLWGAQAASADVAAANVTSVTTLVGTTVFISNDEAIPITSIPELTTIPGTMVSLPDQPATAPTVEPSAPTVSVVPPRAPPDATSPDGRGELTFAPPGPDKCDSATDYAAKVLKPNAQAWVDYLLDHGWSIRINCIKEGHTPNVRGSERTSLHTVGEAFDVDQINGQGVSPSSSESNRFYRWLKARPNTDLPWEVGGPHLPAGRAKILGLQIQPNGPFFTNAGHKGHWHFGFKANTGSFPDGSVAASSAPDPKPTAPQTPAFVLPPPMAKEETVVPAEVVATPDQPDPNDDTVPTPASSEAAPLPSEAAADSIMPVEVPPVVDAPSAAPKAEPTTPAPVPSRPASPASNDGHFTKHSDVMTPSGVTAEQLNRALAGTQLAGLGQAFVQVEQDHGINAVFEAAFAAHESAWGGSRIALRRNNLFGINAVDSDPWKAFGYSSYADCVASHANFLMRLYLTPGATYYNGTTLHDIFIHYSTSHDKEARSIAKIMNGLMDKMSPASSDSSFAPADLPPSEVTP